MNAIRVAIAKYQKLSCPQLVELAGSDSTTWFTHSPCVVKVFHSSCMLSGSSNQTLKEFRNKRKMEDALSAVARILTKLPQVMLFVSIAKP